MNELTIYLDGQYKTVSQAALRAFSPGLLKGLGVFETLLCENGRVYFLKDHYQRFVHGCDRYILPKPISLMDIKKILTQLLKQNQLKRGRVRFSAWRKGWELHFAVMVIPRGSFSEAVYRRGFKACVYPRRFDRPFQIAKIKSLDHGKYLRAYEYALKNDYQEAVLINSNGDIVEGSRSNIFYVKKGKLYSPALADGCLAGVTRQSILKIAKGLGIKTAAGHVSLLDLRKSEEVFLTNALIGIMPLTYFQGHKINDGRPGHTTLRLSKSYKKLSQENSTFLV